jgi:hypothetical protein
LTSKEIGLVSLVDRVGLVADAWTQLAGKTEDIQHQLDAIWLKENEQAKELL